MKFRAEEIVKRLPNKYKDMELTSSLAEKSDEEINLEKLLEMHKSKTDEISEIYKTKKMKDNYMEFFTKIIKQMLITNPVEVETLETLHIIKMREIRTKIMNVLNGMRCYHRNIDLDLRVIGGC